MCKTAKVFGLLAAAVLGSFFQLKPWQLLGMLLVLLGDLGDLLVFCDEQERKYRVSVIIREMTEIQADDPTPKWVLSAFRRMLP